MGVRLGLRDGGEDGTPVGTLLGERDGTSVGTLLGKLVGTGDGKDEGFILGLLDVADASTPPRPGTCPSGICNATPVNILSSWTKGCSYESIVFFEWLLKSVPGRETIVPIVCLDIQMMSGACE